MHYPDAAWPGGPHPAQIAAMQAQAAAQRAAQAQAQAQAQATADHLLLLRR